MFSFWNVSLLKTVLKSKADLFYFDFNRTLIISGPWGNLARRADLDPFSINETPKCWTRMKNSRLLYFLQSTTTKREKIGGLWAMKCYTCPYIRPPPPHVAPRSYWESGSEAWEKLICVSAGICCHISAARGPHLCFTAAWRFNGLLYWINTYLLVCTHTA